MADRSLRLAALLLPVAASSAQAVQPLVTDDAAVLAPKACQLEAWARLAHAGNQYWGQPACNFTGNLELSVGGARVYPDTGEPSSIILLQGKTVLFRRTGGVWSFGALAGGVRDTGTPDDSSAFQAYYAKGLASWHPRSDLEIDLNLGAANLSGAGTFALAGAAIQYAIVTNVQLLAEAFRDDPGRWKYQLGMRYVVVPNRFEAYVSYGNRFDGPPSEWSTTIGIRVQTRAFLP